MLVLAALPGPGILVVVSRTLGGGIKHGAVATLGILSGDYCFIFLSIVGLTALQNVLGTFFVVVKFLGAVYLLFLAWSLLRKSDIDLPYRASIVASFRSSYLSGLLTTLSNPKAILFYAGFFPGFVNLRSLNIADVAMILAITTTAVGGTMMVYATLANRLARLGAKRGGARIIPYLAAVILVGTALWLIFNNL